MAYKVLASFYDLQDGEHYYEKGTTFPRLDAGYKPNQERFDFIESAGFIENDKAEEVVEEVSEEVAAEPKKRGRKKKTADETEE